MSGKHIHSSIAFTAVVSLILGSCAYAGTDENSGQTPQSGEGRASSAPNSSAAGAATTATTGGDPSAGALREMVGLAQRKESVICVAMPAHLAPGYQLTLIAPSAAGVPDSRAAAFAAQVVAGSRDCAGMTPGMGIHSRGDSLFAVVLAQTPPFGGTPLIALAQPFERIVNRSDSVYAQLTNPDRTLAVRVCSSLEGLHYTVWLDAPLTGRRVWHRYYHLGYEMEPTCVPADYEGTGGE